MKKTIILCLGAVLVFALFTACTDNKEGTTLTTEEVTGTVAELEDTQESEDVGLSKTVAFLTFTAEGDFWNMYFGIVEEQLSLLGYEMEIINADMDLILQIEQIDNAVTQGYAGILIIAVDPNGVADACRRAVEAGCPVFAFIKNPGEENITAFRGADEAYVGEKVVDISMDWVNEHWADAAEGSVNTIIIGGNSAGSETERYEAMVAHAAKYPVLNVLDTVRWETSQAYSMQATENLLTQYSGDINVIICGSGEMALGVREAVMAAGSPIQDYTDFGIFTVDLSAQSAESIRKAVNNEDVIRTACVNGGKIVDACAEMAEQMVACIDGTNEKIYIVEAYLATADNLEEFGY